MIPSCADRVEIEGEHTRAGQTLVLDHALDLPWSTTKIVLQSTAGSRVIERVNRAPDVARLGAGCGLGAVGCGLGVLGLLGGGPAAVVTGGGVGAAGAALALTGWHPTPIDDDADLEAWCRETTAPR